MNLTIHERHGGGFCVTLEGDVSLFINRPESLAHFSDGSRAYAEDDTLTLTFGSIDAPPVTFTTFSDLQRVLHGEVRLSLERLDP